MPKKESVTIDGLVKRYGDETLAVDGVTLEVQEGETVGLVGPSGCGKTTTLRSVAGFETPTEGRILFGSDEVTHYPPEQRNVGLVFQTYALFDNMTVQQNVEFGLKMRSIPKEERAERAQEVLDMLDIGDLGNRDPQTLSGGQQERVGLARALAIEPRVLLLDEPMTGLDAKLKKRLQREIGALLDDLDITSIYVTHDQSEAMVMCDRIAVMNEGHLEQIGTPEELYERPANSFVADFIGTSNRLKGTAEDGVVDLGFVTVPTEKEVRGDVTLVIRPDAFEVQDAGGDFQVEVDNRFYQGSYVRTEATLPNGEPVTLKLAREDAVKPGSSLSLSIRPEKVHTLQE